MPDDADWDPADIRYNVIRWIPSLVGNGGAAFGPSRSNPFTGQILDADVVILAPVDYLLFDYPVFDSVLSGASFFRALSEISVNATPWIQDNFFAALERSSGILEILVKNNISDPSDIPRSISKIPQMASLP